LFYKNTTFITIPISKLTWKKKCFRWTKECQQAWEFIEQKQIEALITISPNCREVEFHVHIDVSLLVISVMLAQKIIRKHDQPIVYASWLLNNVNQNYSTIECEALVMVFNITSSSTIF